MELLICGSGANKIWSGRAGSCQRSEIILISGALYAASVRANNHIAINIA